MKLYVIRHGETEINVKGLINARNDVGLNETGIKQAKFCSAQVKSLGIDIIFCSPLKRAVETCGYINCEKLPVIYDERLMERDAGSKQFEKVENIDTSIWYDRTLEKVYENSEGFKNILRRVTLFLEDMKKEYKNENILIVTHGDIFKAIYVYFNPNIKDKDISKYEKLNCEVCEFLF